MIATRDTLLTAFAGLLIGTVIGLCLGLLFGLVRPANKAMEMTVEAIRPIPSVALIPIVMLMLGFGYRMEIVIVAFSCVWPMLILTRSALAGIEPRLLEVAKALRLSASQRIFKIVLPAALPRIMIAQQSLKADLMLAYLCWIGIVGYSSSLLLAAIEGRLLSWRTRAR
ncbi:ABC transporter permease [Phyllobacterium myrsinacearum]|uniref:NitT/TauT family transport system permease protein n=1 Tax=Phyllobacterium myrsinacearum TaxID=28101 RepID=A0A839EQQ7_9HYPH|nr:ABC transporter permease subunit [Phyllobacterium myrsinacearum]MBA8881249.1 NitT/TauT family transport system permease protein [Phyllobacterium myrsinacearum]